MFTTSKPCFFFPFERCEYSINTNYLLNQEEKYMIIYIRERYTLHALLILFYFFFTIIENISFDSTKEMRFIREK